jgi:uncharacterized protein YkwD
MKYIIIVFINIILLLGLILSWDYSKPVGETITSCVTQVSTTDNDIYNIARVKQDDLLKTGYWSHTMSDGTTFFDRNDKYGYFTQTYGEIIYKGKCDLYNATQLWNTSETHSAVMHDTEFTNMILLMDKSTDGECYITAVYKK